MERLTVFFVACEMSCHIECDVCNYADIYLRIIVLLHGLSCELFDYSEQSFRCHFICPSQVENIERFDFFQPL